MYVRVLVIASCEAFSFQPAECFYEPETSATALILVRKINTSYPIFIPVMENHPSHRYSRISKIHTHTNYVCIIY